MFRKYSIWAYFVILLAVFSCTDVLQPDIPGSPKLTVFSLLEPEENIIVALSYSLPVLEKDIKKSYVDDAKIVLFENEIPVDTLERIDSFFYTSKIAPIPGNKYKFTISVPNNDEVLTENVEVLNKPSIDSIKIDSVDELNSSSPQDIIKSSAYFDVIKKYKYIGYTIEAYKNGKTRGGNKWEAVNDYLCGGDEIAGIDEVSLAYIGCLEEIEELQFLTKNYNLEDIDSIKFKLCMIPDFTGYYTNNSVLSGFSIVAADDNVNSNVDNGYGAILTISCSEKVLVLK